MNIRMKKYIAPQMVILEMETTTVIAASGDGKMGVYDQTSDLQLESRNRGEAWSDYESR
jgi:hypothetical protein